MQPRSPWAIFSHLIRKKNPDQPIIIVCDNFSSHFAAHVDDVCGQLNIRRVSLPRYSPDLNPIEQIWKSLKRDLSPLDAPNLEEYRRLIRETYHGYCHRLSFAIWWIERFLPIQEL